MLDFGGERKVGDSRERMQMTDSAAGAIKGACHLLGYCHRADGVSVVKLLGYGVAG